MSENTDPISMPAVEISRLVSVHRESDERFVLSGDRQSSLTINGARLAVSREHQVTFEPFGPGIHGGHLTLTLNCDRLSIDGEEIGYAIDGVWLLGEAGDQS
ncbi:hypothetical protein ACFVT5_41390 [Streptomyces sp. NPDC058001]|uniref:hypothetical protein n=1 Tax=Streptomyces sp. NPDC058001 TaxID=3346300 RepID=UPI0036E8606A